MFKIIIDDDIEIFNNQLNTVFYIKCNEYAFPDKEWTDFPVGLLHMWIDNIISSCSSDCELKLYFLDGPYFIHCFKNGDIVSIKCIDAHNTESMKCVCECTTSFTQFASDVSGAIMTLQNLVEKHNLQIPEMRGVMSQKIVIDELLNRV